MTNASSGPYKRDQVERAIAITSGIRPSAGSAQFASLKVELKRLLERDRRQAREIPPGHPVRQAFHDGPPPGRGVDVMYTGYEAYALLIALRSMRGGLTQARAVEFVRDLRPVLAAFHERALRDEPGRLRADLGEAALLNALANGFLVRDADRMVFLTTLAGDRAGTIDLPAPADAPVSGNICRTVEQLHQRLVYASQFGHAAIVIELVNAAHQLAHHLGRIEPRPRGRQ